MTEIHVPYAVVGGGVLGLEVAHELTSQKRGPILVIEKNSVLCLILNKEI